MFEVALLSNSLTLVKFIPAVSHTMLLKVWTGFYSMTRNQFFHFKIVMTKSR